MTHSIEFAILSLDATVRIVLQSKEPSCWHRTARLILLGSTAISRAYIGDELVFQEKSGGLSDTVGKVWTEETNLPLPTYAQTYNNLAFGNGIFLSAMTRERSYDGLLMSNDGKTWKNQTGYGMTAQPMYVFYANDKFFCSQRNGFVKYSADGITWTSVTIGGGTSGYWNIYGGDGKYVAADSSGANVYFSSDGISWEKGTAPTTFYQVAYGDGIFLATGNTNNAYTSVDGKEWVAVGRGPSYANSIFYHNGEFYTCGISLSYKIMKYNPKTGVWTDISSAFSNSGVVNAALYGFTGDKDIIILLRGQSAHSSRDGGVTWDAVSFPVNREWTNPAFGNGIIVTLCKNATLKKFIWSA